MKLPTDAKLSTLPTDPCRNFFYSYLLQTYMAFLSTRRSRAKQRTIRSARRKASRRKNKYTAAVRSKSSTPYKSPKRRKPSTAPKVIRHAVSWTSPERRQTLRRPVDQVPWYMYRASDASEDDEPIDIVGLPQYYVWINTTDDNITNDDFVFQCVRLNRETDAFNSIALLVVNNDSITQENTTIRWDNIYSIVTMDVELQNILKSNNHGKLVINMSPKDYIAIDPISAQLETTSGRTNVPS